MIMRVHIKPAATGKYHHSYDSLTLATMDFRQLVNIKNFECVSSDDINKFHGSCFLRLAPQVFPAYGKAFLKTAAFFVPEYQIIEGSEALRNNMNSYKGKPIDFVHIYHDQILEVFTNHYQGPGSGILDWVTLVGQGSSTTDIPSSPSYDFVSVGANGAVSTFFYWKLTAIGRSMYKILKGCGIDFPSPSMSGTFQTDLDSIHNVINLNCLLSYCKVYCDMFINQHRYNDDPLVALLHHIHDNDTYVVNGITYFDASSGIVSTAALDLMLSHIRVPFMANMYSSSWNSPNSPVGVNPSTVMDGVNPNGIISPYSGSPAGGVGNTLITTVQDTLLQSNNNTPLSYLSTFGQRVFQAFFKFVQRNNLVGNKAVQRTLARLGIKSDDYNSHYVRKLYENTTRIDFSAIMSNSDTAPSGGKNLGSYAGFGIASCDIDFNYKCQENGFIIVLAWIQQSPLWFRGTSPFNLRRYSQDYWTPEYDGETIRAIPMVEFTSSKTPVRTDTKDGTPFGYTDLYDEYRFPRDQVLGDFVLDENTTRQFFFGRDVSSARDSRITTAFKPQTNFIQYWDNDFLDQIDINNPFQWSAKLADRFYLSVDWSIEAQRPIKSKSDALLLNGSGDLDIDLGSSLVD